MNFVGGDLYAGDIPAQPADTLVSYYVWAVDDQDEATRFPPSEREYRYLTGYVPPVVLVNEIVVVNNSIPDPDEPAEFPDWIELYNPGNAPVSLNGLSLTDDKSDPVKYMIPDGLTIPAKGLLIFLADDDPGQGPTHLNFQLNADGDYVALRGGFGTVLIDAYDIDRRPMLGAIGRVPDGGAWSEQVCPTFGTSNLLCDKMAFLPVAEK